MSDDIYKRWSKEDEFFNSGPADPCADIQSENDALLRKIDQLDEKILQLRQALEKIKSAQDLEEVFTAACSALDALQEAP